MCVFISSPKLQYRFFFLPWSHLYHWCFSLMATRSLTGGGKAFWHSATKPRCWCLFPPTWEPHRNRSGTCLPQMWQSKASSRELLQMLPAHCLGSRAWGTAALPHFAWFKSSWPSGGKPDSLLVAAAVPLSSYCGWWTSLQFSSLPYLGSPFGYPSLKQTSCWNLMGLFLLDFQNIWSKLYGVILYIIIIYDNISIYNILVYYIAMLYISIYINIYYSNII